ncbi:MAG: hypothetical protein AAF889_03130 [Cyanobacteria bacterium P01_D01_bin.73]
MGNLGCWAKEMPETNGIVWEEKLTGRRSPARKTRELAFSQLAIAISASVCSV